MKIQIGTEMVEPLNKICALADLFDAAGCDDIRVILFHPNESIISDCLRKKWSNASG